MTNQFEDVAKTPPAYSDALFGTIYGATPAFSHAGTKVEMNCSVPREEEWDLWKVALNVLERLAEDNPALASLFRHAQGLDVPNGQICAMGLGFVSLQTAMNIPAYPLEIRDKDQDNDQCSPRKISLYTACPYEQFVKSAFWVITNWLNWSHVAQDQGQLRVARRRIQEWQERFGQLAGLLPPRSVAEFHHELWNQGITWQWMDTNRTRVGQGVRQKLLSHANETPALSEMERWRIPIYTVTGSVGKTTTARLLWQLLRPSCKNLALTASDGAWVGDKKATDGDCIGGVSARDVLRHSKVQAAVFEQGRGGIVKQGVPYSHSDVGILLNVQEVHLGLDNIETVEEMADVKALGLRPAKLAVLNFDDAQCRRIGETRSGASCIWFSIMADAVCLQTESETSAGSVGLERNALGKPQAIQVWQDGNPVCRLVLEDVAPYHGTLGEKTLEELLAVVAAAWFGPLPVDDLQTRLINLSLDSENHTFRTSLHKNGRVIFILDKAGEAASLQSLKEAVNDIAKSEHCQHRILMVCRSAGETAERHLESANALFEFMDEFICFDRPESYTTKSALPTYSPGSIPELLQEAFSGLNEAQGLAKPIEVVGDWQAAEEFLVARLERIEDRVLVLVNQPSTGSAELNNRILAFVQREPLGRKPET